METARIATRTIEVMKRATALVPLSWGHHHGLAMARRIAQEVDGSDEALVELYSALLGFWSGGLLPHFRVEGECLLGRLIRHVGADAPEPRRLLGDHLELAGLVATMRDTADPETRRSALRHFGDRLRAHIRWEEETLFEFTQQKLTADEVAALGEDVVAALPNLVPAPRKANGERVIP